MISPCRSADFSRKECEIIAICAKEKVEGPAKGQEGQRLYQWQDGVFRKATAIDANNVEY